MSINIRTSQKVIDNLNENRDKLMLFLESVSVSEVINLDFFEEGYTQGYMLHHDPKENRIFVRDPQTFYKTKFPFNHLIFRKDEIIPPKNSKGITVTVEDEVLFSKYIKESLYDKYKELFNDYFGRKVPEMWGRLFPVSEEYTLVEFLSQSKNLRNGGFDVQIFYDNIYDHLESEAEYSQTQEFAEEYIDFLISNKVACSVFNIGEGDFVTFKGDNKVEFLTYDTRQSRMSGGWFTSGARNTQLEFRTEPFNPRTKLGRILDSHAKGEQDITDDTRKKLVKHYMRYHKDKISDKFRSTIYTFKNRYGK